MTELARQHGGTTSEGVRKAIRRVVALLPDPELVASKHRTLVEWLQILRKVVRRQPQFGP